MLRRALALLVAVAAIVTGCRVEANVHVAVRPDGSGRVVVTATFDEDAAARVGDDQAAQLRLDDLEAAGWSVEGPATDDGSQVVTLTKPFSSASGLGTVMDELGGSPGIFGDWRLSTANSFTAADYHLTGSVRLTGSLDQFSDGDVAAALDGFATGRSPQELAQELAANPEGLVLTVSAALPGEIVTASGLEHEPGTDADPTWSGALGTGSATDLDVSVRTTESDRSSVLWMLLGGASIVGAGLLFAAGRRQEARRRRTVERRRDPSS